MNRYYVLFIALAFAVGAHGAGLSSNIGYYSQYPDLLGGIAYDGPVVQGSLSGSLPTLTGKELSGGVWASWPTSGAPGYGREVDLWVGSSHLWLTYSLYWIAVHPLERTADDVLAPYLSLDPPALPVASWKLQGYARCFHFRRSTFDESRGTFLYGGLVLSDPSSWLNQSLNFQLGWDTGSFGREEGLLAEVKGTASIKLSPGLKLNVMPIRVQFPISGAADRHMEYTAGLGLAANVL